MNVEIANRLVQLRKERGLSQEDIADKLGLSRQAISKWERSEASPDTDNLIALARLYGMSLDELLGYTPEETEEKSANDEPKNKDNKDNENYAHISLKDGIHVEDGKDSVHISWKDGIHVTSHDGNSVHTDDEREHIIVNGKEYDIEKTAQKHTKRAIFSSIFATMVVITYVVLGFTLNLWHPAWMIFLLIPIVESLVSAIRNKKANQFAYPVFLALVYLALGFFVGWWNSAWVIFLSIPVYYIIFRDRDKDEDDDD